MSYDSSTSIRITSDHLLTDDGNDTSKSVLQIFPWKAIQQNHSEQKIAKVWKALPRKLGVWWSSEGQLLPTGQRGQRCSSGGRAEHFSHGQSPATRSRAGQAAAGVTPNLGIRHLCGDGDGMRPVWDIDLRVGVRTQSREKKQSALGWGARARQWGWSNLFLMPDPREAMRILWWAATATRALRNKKCRNWEFPILSVEEDFNNRV